MRFICIENSFGIPVWLLWLDAEDMPLIPHASLRLICTLAVIAICCGNSVPNGARLEKDANEDVSRN